MIRRLRSRSLSFRGKLILGFVGLSFASIVGVSALLTTLDNRRAIEGVRDKATRYARQIAPAMSPVVAFNDQLTARELFESFVTDSDVAGLAVFSSDGDLISGLGAFPSHLVDGRPETPVANGQIVVLAPVMSAEGPRGRLYVSLTTRAAEQYVYRSVLTTLAIAIAALGFAVAAAMILSRGVARRVGTIAMAARTVASGALDQPDLAPGPDDDIGQLAVAFNRMVSNLRQQFVERAQLAASEQARLESIVSERTSQLLESREEYRLIAESTNAIPFTFDPVQSRFIYVGPQAQRLLGFSREECVQDGFLDVLLPDHVERVRARLCAAAPGRDFELGCAARTAEGRTIHLRWVVSSGELLGASCLRGLILDITEQQRLEADLAQAQKLESVGRLAAGVAHEINTPVQFVSDSVHFLRDGTTDLIAVIGKLQVVHQSVREGRPSAEASALASEAEEAADLVYLFEHMPKAIDRALDGLGRVATIVRSMKEFAHPDAKEKGSLDLNRGIQSTVVMARGEYKYVADLETTYGDVPPVVCHPGDIKQAILNIIVNGAHAVADVVRVTGIKGRIIVRTYVENGYAVVAIADTGGGIPSDVAGHIFDPFFTTKEVGKGTGQGLAIARAIVVEKHGGQLTFETELGKGTTFWVRLPLTASTTTSAIESAA